MCVLCIPGALPPPPSTGAAAAVGGSSPAPAVHPAAAILRQLQASGEPLALEPYVDLFVSREGGEAFVCRLVDRAAPGGACPDGNGPGDNRYVFKMGYWRIALARGMRLPRMHIFMTLGPSQRRSFCWCPSPLCCLSISTKHMKRPLMHPDTLLPSAGAVQAEAAAGRELQPLLRASNAAARWHALCCPATAAAASSRPQWQ